MRGLADFGIVTLAAGPCRRRDIVRVLA